MERKHKDINEHSLFTSTLNLRCNNSKALYGILPRPRRRQLYLHIVIKCMFQGNIRKKHARLLSPYKRQDDKRKCLLFAKP